MRECAITGFSEISDAAISRMISYIRYRNFSDTHLEIGTAAAGSDSS